MVEEIATVVATEVDGVWLTTTPVGSCNSCQVNQDCGTGIVAKTFTPRQQRFFVNTTLSLLPGEQVRVGIAEQGLMAAALFVYLVPLSLMLIALLILQALWQPSEIILILAAVLTLAAGFMLARSYDRRRNLTEQVTILEVLPALKIQRL